MRNIQGGVDFTKPKEEFYVAPARRRGAVEIAFALESEDPGSNHARVYGF
jgi:hypothetical protein